MARRAPIAIRKGLAIEAATLLKIQECKCPGDGARSGTVETAAVKHPLTK
jgi:hypothetical protein